MFAAEGESLAKLSHHISQSAERRKHLFSFRLLTKRKRIECGLKRGDKFDGVFVYKGTKIAETNLFSSVFRNFQFSLSEKLFLCFSKFKKISGWTLFSLKFMK